ncbi:putative nucleic acid-binding protein [Rhizobium paknamense]|uniref:Nucleic acid-binding protein n=1 Tax=Rhizobium paknamense TaxID=1206817 RepID=A0ABU0I7I6_9HYPH|nr:putative nucleic acid-binding protein [Rhizobium paknamense]
MTGASDLLTNNTRAFARVPGLTLENWLAEETEET